MVNTPAHPGPFDPLVDADPDVPFFPLMGTDALAPDLVLAWADRARTAARDVADPKERRRQLMKALEAEEIAWAMQRYQRTGSAGEVRPAEVRATYQGEGAEPDQDFLWRAALGEGTRFLREAAYQLAKAAEHLPEPQRMALAAEVEGVNRIATAWEPRRASYGAAGELPALETA